MLSLFPHRYLVAAAITLVCLTVPRAFGQDFLVRGFGLSGDPSELDTIVEHGEDVYGLVFVQVPAGWEMTGVGVPGLTDSVRIWFYDEEVPAGDPSLTQMVPLDTAETEINADSGLISFKLAVPLPLPSNLHSLQLELVVLGLDSEGAPQMTPLVTSFLDVGDADAINDPIDEFHHPYLHVEPVSPSRPVIHTPTEGDTLLSSFEVTFDQPLNARENTLMIMIREFPSEGGLLVHYLTVTDPLAGTGKQVILDARDLNRSDGISQVLGAPYLMHRAEMELSIFYQPTTQELMSDTAVVGGLVNDFETEPCTLTEPNIGSYSPYPDVRVIFRLGEPAEVVTLTFQADTAGFVDDSLSPHVLTLAPDFYNPGEHYLLLDGTNIGTGGPHVLHNPNGQTDALISQAIYYVILSYEDVLGNTAASDSTYGFVWPHDSTTVPPTMSAPVNDRSENPSVWVEFTLPEAPLLGSVYLAINQIPPVPGTSRTIYLGELSAQGTTGLILNGLALDLSGPPVTSVIGINALDHNSEYLIRVFYRDYLGNLPATSVGRRFLYDAATDAPELTWPPAGDTLSLIEQEVVFSIPERAAPGTLKLIFEQTGGPDVDILSPHTLYLSDVSQGADKTVQFNPSFLIAGPGVDSVHNAGSLISRGTYKISVEYSDTLLNPASRDTEFGYLLASGSTVSIRGGELGFEVRPGTGDNPLFYLGLTAQNESAARSVRFELDGGLEPTDVIESGFILWQSADTVLSVATDTPIDTLDEWYGGGMVFDSFTVLLSELEEFLLVGGKFSVNANPAHEAHLVIPDGSHVGCSGDPVNCHDCPLGTADYALPVELLSMETRPDTSFNALVVSWLVASEANNLGFRLWRRAEGQDGWQMSADYTTSDQLYGRGYASSERRYAYVDRGLEAGQTYYYRLDAIAMDGLTVHELDGEASGTVPSLPGQFRLFNAFPNPFNSLVTIHFVVPVTDVVRLEMFDILGHKVRTLLSRQMPASEYHVQWDSRDDRGELLPSGVYFYRLTIPGLYAETQKLLLIR